VARNDRSDEGRPARGGYAAAIVVSAIGHLALFALIFFVLPKYLNSAEPPPPAYTVKIVDNLPAGDLGTHLPRLAPPEPKESKAAAAKPAEPKVKVEEPKPEVPNEPDKSAIALNSIASPTLTPTPTPEPTIMATPEPTPSEMPSPTPAHTHRATPKPTPVKAREHKPKTEPTIALARAESTPSVAQRLAKIRQQLLANRMKELAKQNAEDEDTDEPDSEATGSDEGGGPVAAKTATEGKGYGVGSGTGSVGIQQDPEFLLYYQTVQDKIKKAWNFFGGSNDLTATVDFAIGPDGTLTAAKIGNSSKDSAFDDSVIRAIKRAAPFPPPPEKYRDRFAGGIEAVFNLGELKS